MNASGALQKILFPGDGEAAYAILDGASCDELMGKLAELRPEHICLYAGELAPDVEAVAPYLVALPPDHAFTAWLFAEGFGKHWGIFARSASGIRNLRRHFRSFLRIKDPSGKILYFRYYDPRVLQAYLPTCQAREIRTVFGPVSSYLAEAPASSVLIRFHVEEDTVQRKEVPLSI